MLASAYNESETGVIGIEPSPYLYKRESKTRSDVTTDPSPSIFSAIPLQASVYCPNFTNVTTLCTSKSLLRSFAHVLQARHEEGF